MHNSYWIIRYTDNVLIKGPFNITNIIIWFGSCFCILIQSEITKTRRRIILHVIALYRIVIIIILSYCNIIRATKFVPSLVRKIFKATAAAHESLRHFLAPFFCMTFFYIADRVLYISLSLSRVCVCVMHTSGRCAAVGFRAVQEIGEEYKRCEVYL